MYNVCDAHNTVSEKFFMSSWLTQIPVSPLLASHVSIFINTTVF